MAESIFSIALRGIRQGLHLVNDGAQRFGRSFHENSAVDPIEPLTQIKIGELQVKASAKIVKVGGKLDDAVLDILA